MSDAAEDARDQEEMRELEYALHKQRRCKPDCSYCDIEREEQRDGGKRLLETSLLCFGDGFEGEPREVSDGEGD